MFDDTDCIYLDETWTCCNEYSEYYGSMVDAIDCEDCPCYS